MPKEPWRDLMRRDELKAAQAVHRMLYGFVEVRAKLEVVDVIQVR